MFERPRTGERAVLVRLGLGAPVDPEDLQEFTQLARLGRRAAGRDRDRPPRSSRSALLHRQRQGRGAQSGRRTPAAADVILVDHALSPSQERNLEKLIERRVLDRNGLILDIFAQRARSFEGKLEVELAQLKHIASRLVRGWTHLERQKGGIGLRGPGETQLETDRRIIGQRVQRAHASAWRRSSSSARPAGRCARRSRCPRSRSSATPTPASRRCFAALTGADAYVADQLFATLDPTVRRIALPGGTPVVVADTVGFIRELPHELVAAFQSTLTEARAATLLLHVVDASNPRRDEQIAQVDAVLAEIGAGQIPQLLVYNKIDRLESARAHRSRRRRARHRGVDLRRSSASGSICWSARWPSAWRALRAARACGCRRAPARCARACTRHRRCARRSSAPDGSIELAVELPDLELLTLARTAGVQILEVQASRHALCPRGAPTYNRRPLSSATK